MSMFTRIIDLQKLTAAWQHVKRNHPASGADDITWQQFDENQKKELYQLHVELKEGRYEPVPVKEVTLYKGDKERKIALFSMRDKVLHQSMVVELEKIYEPRFNSRCFAYRPDKSALNAADEIEIAVVEYPWILKLDIHSFFDTIEQKRLLKLLSLRIKEEDVLQLMKQIMETRILNKKTGGISKRSVGIYQGSSLAPIWSNIYMMEFDDLMCEQAKFYVRYSDDMLFMGKEKDELEQIHESVRNYLESVGLTLAEEKTSLNKTSDGVEYLGFYFDETGKKSGKKAEAGLRERLEAMWLTEINKTPEEKLKKICEIMTGWDQYYREQRIPGDILEYAARLYMMQRDISSQNTVDYIKFRFRFENPYADLVDWLVKFWKKIGKLDYVRQEYEQYFHKLEFDPDVEIDVQSVQHEELLNHYQKIFIAPSKEEYENLMQIYSDLKCYNTAASWQQDLALFLANSEFRDNIITEGHFEVEWKPDDGELHQFMSLFIGREDLYAVEHMEKERRIVQTVYEPLTEEVVKEHLKGKFTVHTYIRRGNSTSSFFVVDLDISKKILLQYSYQSVEFKKYLEKALNTALRLKKKLGSIGLMSYLEFSGYRGYHLWIFFQEWIPIRYINLIQDYIEINIKPEILDDGDIQMEFFPNKGKTKPGKPGQCIMIPYGVHLKSAQVSCFLDKEGKAITDIGNWLKDIVCYSLNTLKKTVSRLSVKNNSALLDNRLTAKQIDLDLAVLRNPDDKIKEVLLHCNLMRYLCQKAVYTGYLGHFERLSILYVFGHLGDSGKQFVHTVMEFTLNYQFQVTEKFIHRLPEKPVSCIKLRDQYKTITAEYGCSCNFRHTSDCYPSPVLHALKNVEEDISDITVPTSRTLTKEKEKKAVDNLNIHKKVQDLSHRIVDFKKQRRGIEKNIRKLEGELESIFDQLGVDCMEIEMGLLVRRKTENGYEWIVEL